MTKISDAFRRVADAIDHNDGKGDFAGAFCIVAPPIEEGGEPKVIEGLYLDSEKSGASFWGIISGRIKVVVDGISDLERQGRPMRR